MGLNQQPPAPSVWSLFAKEDGPAPPASPLWNLLAHAPDSPGPEGAGDHQAPPSPLVFDEQLMFWALRNLDIKEAVKHLAIIGCTGSGKSTLIQLFLQSVAPRFRAKRKHPEQLIIFDGKSEVLPNLAALGLNPEDPHENVYVLNPNDRRCAVWDFAEATRTPFMARYLAALLVPQENSNAPYFADSARDLIFAVLLALSAPGNLRWEFRDLICALDSRERILSVAARHPRAKVIAQRILHDTKHSFGVLSTVGTKIVRFEQVAALWHTARHARRFTIQKFLERPGVLVLGNDPVLHDSIWPINALLLKALTHEILRQKETRRPRFWFVLDEFPAMEQVECIHDLLRRGRSKGASVLLGTQGIEALIGIYGEHATNDILSQCTYKTFLRAGGPKTAEWAQSHFGPVRRTEASYSESWSREGTSHSRSYKVVERAMFLSSFFLSMPMPDAGRSLTAVSDVPCLDTTLVSRRWFSQLLSWIQRARDGKQVAAVKPRDNAWEQTLEGWSDAEERSFFGLPPDPCPTSPDNSVPPEVTEPPKPYLPDLG